MADVSPRLQQRLRRDYDAATVEDVLARLADVPEHLPLADKQDPERLQASVIVGHDGTWTSVERRLRMLHQDWRDALVAAGLAQPDWPERLDRELGPR